jgi:hypothetical protein
MQELWHPVVGHEGRYEVSNTGSVRSCTFYYTTRNKWSTFTRVKHGRVLAQKLDRYGYYVVHLCLGKRGSNLYRPVHSLVAEAFLGPKPEGLIVLHGPRGKLCNEVSNLSYGTHAQNSRDRLRDGTHVYGEAMWTNILTEEQVLYIYENCGPRGAPQRLAKEFGVSVSCIHHIKYGRSWAYLTQRNQ